MTQQNEADPQRSHDSTVLSEEGNENAFESNKACDKSVCVICVSQWVHGGYFGNHPTEN